ncbi:uncharacterized protein LOC129249158 [Anastrepha obliqua]|uniref:uncharacterized protein LOC129249158 n=1 Tax=Anastrepha obliqua TaxID=95512 RepID=UPI00240A2213|nr:uncharacterized protein LOC129249158 [Anastrepha obliqua]
MNAPLKMLYHTKSATFSAAFSILLICCCFLPSAEPLVVPQELPSILSLIYSNIPPIKKGTDSRLGFGFRLGNHADFQVLLELGPQKNTRPIGENADSENTFNKRQVSKAHRDYLLRKQAQEALKQLTSSTTATITTSEATGGSWLENWSKAMNTNRNSHKEDTGMDIAMNKKKSTPKFTQSVNKKQQQQSEKLSPTLATVNKSMMQLQMLYQMATTTTTSTTTGTPMDADSGTGSPMTIITTVPQFQRLPAPIAPNKGGPLSLGGPTGFTPRPPEELALQIISELQGEKKSKSEITKELMNVSLEEGE